MKAKLTDREKQKKKREQTRKRVKKFRQKKRKEKKKGDKEHDKELVKKYYNEDGSERHFLPAPVKEIEYETIYKNEYPDSLYHELYGKMVRKNPQRQCTGKCRCHTRNTHCGDDCPNRAREVLMLLQGNIVCNLNNCGFGDKDCTNRIEQKTYLTSCAVQHVRCINGKGLKAIGMIPKGAIIGEYVGVVGRTSDWKKDPK